MTANDRDLQKNMLMRLGFVEDTAYAVYDQGYIDLKELKILTEDEVSDLCKIIRKPGGQITTGEGAAAVTNPDPGEKVLLVTEGNLKLACYYLRHRFDRIQRPPTRINVTMTNVRKLRELFKFDKSYKYPTKDEYPKIDDPSWPDTFDALDHFLRVTRGEAGIPLLYVVREDSTVPAFVNDPETNYDTPEDEMIIRAPHHYVDALNVILPHPTFVSNNHKV